MRYHVAKAGLGSGWNIADAVRPELRRVEEGPLVVSRDRLELHARGDRSVVMYLSLDLHVAKLAHHAGAEDGKADALTSGARCADFLASA
jgi:hypothetical protein